MTPLQLAERRITHLEAIIADQDETIRQMRREAHLSAGEDVCSALRAGAGLTTQEAHLLAILYAANGRPMRRVALNDGIPQTIDTGAERSPRAVDVWIYRVRNKLGFETIKSVSGGLISITAFGIDQVNRCLAGETVRPPGAPVRRGCLLTINDAREILALKDVVSPRGVCQRYGVSVETVHDIWAGRRWAGAAAAVPVEVAA